MRKTWTYLIVVVLFVGFTGFYSKVEKENNWPILVQKELALRLKAFEEERRKTCLAEIVRDAEMYVDSIIIDEINTQIMDTLVFPDRPEALPSIHKIVLDDSTRLALPEDGQKK